MANSSSGSVVLGILGGGQLALYLCQAASKLGVETCLLCPQTNALAAPFATTLVDGDMDDSAAVSTFLNKIDIATFEREDVPDRTLQQMLAAEQAGNIQILPSAQLLATIKDKGVQKQWLDDHDFPVVPWQLLTLADGEQAPAELSLPFVQKARTGGFDGRGVQIIRTQEDLAGIWDGETLIESFIEERLELSVITARSTTGELASYPPVQMEFDPELNAVNTVFTPANISTQIADQAIALAQRLVTEINAVGVCAVEMFLVNNDTLLINEISPRVHNSGHLTMEASPASQFEQHVRAVTGRPLIDVADTSTAAMANILYEEAFRPHCPAQPSSNTMHSGNTVLHWYGKPPGNIGRKMGHITTLDTTPSAAVEQVQKALDSLRSNQSTVTL